MYADMMIRVLEGLHKIKRPAYLQSSPGLGKTSIANQVGKNLNLPVIHIHGPSLLVENLGIPHPVVEEKSIEFFMTGMLPIEGSPHAEEGIVLLDDAGQCGGDIQKVFANLIHAREVYGHKIKPGWGFILTGNRVEDRAGSNKLLTHFADRMTILPLEFDAVGWATGWAQENGIDSRVIAFALWQPGAFNNFDPNRAINATPRSWAEGVSKTINVVPAEALFEVIYGDVGAIAVNFMGFLEYCEVLPTKAEFLKNPKGIVAGLKEWHKEPELDKNGQKVLDKSGGEVLKLVRTPGRSANLAPDLAYSLAGMLLFEMKLGDFEAAMDAAAELPKDLGSMILSTYLRKIPGVAVAKRTRLAQEISRYNGVLAGEKFAERDYEKRVAAE